MIGSSPSLFWYLKQLFTNPWDINWSGYALCNTHDAVTHRGTRFKHPSLSKIFQIHKSILYSQFILGKNTNGQDSTSYFTFIAMATTSSNASSSNSSDKGETTYLVTQSISVAIATLLVLTRVYVKTIVVQKFGLDDSVIVLALVSILRSLLAYTDSS